MKNKPIFFTMLTGFSIVSWIYFKCCRKRVPETINVEIEKDKKGIWRIRDEKGRNKGTIKVRRGDNVNWHTEESEMVFTFSEDLTDYFETGRGLFKDGRAQQIKKGESLQVKLKNTAPRGKLVYEVYVVDADTFVVGNSPPVMIII